MSNAKKAICKECGMQLSHPAEFHPYEFCILAKSGQDPRRLYASIVERVTSSLSSLPSEGAEGEMKILFDYLADLEELDAELRRLRAAEVRYREHIEGILRIIKSADRYNSYDDLKSVLTSAEWACKESLSHSDDQPVPSKSSMGLLLKETKPMPSDQNQRIRDFYTSWNEMETDDIYSSQTIASIIADVAGMFGVNVEEDGE